MSSRAPSKSSDQVFRIGPLLVSNRKRTVLDGETALLLPPKVVDLLLVLLRHAGETVSRDDLKQKVWYDDAIDDGNLSKNIYLLRNALKEKLGDGHPDAFRPRLSICR